MMIKLIGVDGRECRSKKCEFSVHFGEVILVKKMYLVLVVAAVYSASNCPVKSFD